MVLGAAKDPMVVRTFLRTSSWILILFAFPLVDTKAFKACPVILSGTPITAASTAFSIFLSDRKRLLKNLHNWIVAYRE